MINTELLILCVSADAKNGGGGGPGPGPVPPTAGRPQDRRSQTLVVLHRAS